MKFNLTFTVTTLVVLCVQVHSLDNGLGTTPGLGWNSDYCTNCVGASGWTGSVPPSSLELAKLGGFQNEEYIKQLALWMNTSGFQQLGYNHLNLDASWNTLARDNVTKNWIPDTALWPSGIEATIDYVHSLDLNFGLYGDRGTQDCAGRPGNLGFETIDANFLAAHKVDWYKSDSCYASDDPDTAFAEYGTMRDALNATGRHIWFALCGWNAWYAPVGNTLGNSWRVGVDTGSGWAAIMSNVMDMLTLAPFGARNASGGGWNDMSLMLSPGMGSGANLMSNERHRSQFVIHCIFNVNILTTGNLSNQAPYVLETWMNPEAISINQDVSHQFIVLSSDERLEEEEKEDSAYSFAKVSECGGEPLYQNWTFNTPMQQFLYNPTTESCLNVDNCQTQIIYDGCTTTKGTCSGPNTYLNEQWTLQADGSLISMLPGKPCATVAADDSVILTPCTSPLSVNQTWKYIASSGELQQGSNGNCLTAPTPAPPANFSNIFVTRQLQDNTTWAIVALNNQPVNGTIVCGPKCFATMGFQPTDTLIVRDIWLHQDVNTTSATSYPIAVGANGSTTFLTFRKQ